MIIRKLFKFENAHIVRFCSSKKCKTSIHGHSYKLEILLKSNYLDDAQMVYDFGLIKKNIKCIVDSFDHALTIYNKDDDKYIQDLKEHSQRWISIPVNASAEQFSRIFFVITDRLLKTTVMQNGEREVELYSIIIHETDTGYAQCFKEDAYNIKMGDINLKDIVFSKAIIEDWEDKELFEKIINHVKIINPKEV